MKSAIELLKLVSLLLLLQWLCSCNNRATTVKLIHAYNDSIGVAKRGLMQIQYGRDSIDDAYSRQCPITAFQFTREGARAREAFIQKERAAFKEQSLAKTLYNNATAEREWQLISCIATYHKIIDSLKIELNN